jgi:hypothetical protein
MLSRLSIDLLHKSQKGEAFAKVNPDFTSNVAAQMLRPYNQKSTFARGLVSRVPGDKEQSFKLLIPPQVVKIRVGFG